MITVSNIGLLRGIHTARSLNSANTSFKAKKQPENDSFKTQNPSNKAERHSDLLEDFEANVKELRKSKSPQDINRNLARYVKDHMNGLMEHLSHYNEQVQAINIILENACPQNSGINLVCKNLPAVFGNIDIKDRNMVINNVLDYIKPEYYNAEDAYQGLVLSLTKDTTAPLDKKSAFNAIVDKASQNKCLTKNTVTILRTVIPYLSSDDQSEATTKLNKSALNNSPFKNL